MEAVWVVNGDVGDVTELGLACWKKGWTAECGDEGTVYTWKGSKRMGGIMKDILEDGLADGGG